MPAFRSLATTPRTGVLAAVAALVIGLLWLPSSGSDLRLSADEAPVVAAPASSAPIRIVQANIKSGLSKKKTLADVAGAYAQAPDFVTFNEVTYRPDAWLTGPGYELWRTPGAYTGETPVAWNTNRWNAVDKGTFLISNKMRKAKSRKFELGLRYANWVSLQSKTGERISVVSAHFAPRAGYTVGLIEPSFQRLSVLVNQLRAHGPVLVGGDLNVNYRAPLEFPRTLVTSLGLTPVYDVTGVALPTGMYRDATIDYVLMASAGEFSVSQQATRDGFSDHRQLMAEVALTGTSASAFTPGTVLSDPATSPRAVTDLLRRSIDLAPKGAVVHLISRDLKLRAIEKAIRKAVKRGVHVQVLTGSATPKAAERRLASLLGTKVRKKSWIARQTDWAKYGLPVASSLVSASGGTTALRIDSSQPVTKASHAVPTRAVITADKASYDQLFLQFFRAVGRKV